MVRDLLWDGCGALIVRDVAVVGLRLHQIGLLIDSRPCGGHGLVAEWPGLGKFDRVWCGLDLWC